MIKIDNLTKIYRSKRKSNVKALDNINLILPDSGLVFVLGKSGSGKSTLLNLIGGLDSITEGTVIVDGNDITNFKENAFCDYRNTHIGFIFQDYHLIDELTVYDNIMLSLNLRRIEDKELVSEALKKVDLEGYENRYPTELSGGERQRVAIARAVVKNPRIILADEPTGNLDTHTAKAIVEILKELSKNCLILIVSHNVDDANKYADRIIELAKGKIIKDQVRNPEFNEKVNISGDNIIYPIDTVLNLEDIELINNNKNLKLVTDNKKFLNTEAIDATGDKLKIEKKNLSIAKELMLSLKFLKNKILNIFLSSFMVSVIMVILALAQTIITFDSNIVMQNELQNRGVNSIYVEKNSGLGGIEIGVSNYSYIMDITDNDKNALKDIISDDSYYSVYSYTLPVTNSYNYTGIKYTTFNNRLYATESLGTMVVDEAFFIKKIGSLEYLAISSDIREGGVYITDYLADSILKHNTQYANNSYEDILGDYYSAGGTRKRGYINGIIKTGYKDIHAELFRKNEKDKMPAISNYYQDEDFLVFSQNVYDYLGFTYSFNKNFKNDIVDYCENELTFHTQMTIDDIELTYNLGSCQIGLDNTDAYGLNDGEVVMSYTKYNQIFKTTYDIKNLNTFVPHKIVVKQFKHSDSKMEEPELVKELYIKKLVSSTTTFYCKEDLFKEFNELSIFEKGLYYNQNDKVTSIINYANNNSFKYNSFIADGIHTMTKAVDVFIPIFRMIAIVLCTAIVFILINFSTKMINDKLHDIGILKALGTQNRSIAIVFGIQIILIAILTIVMSTLGYFIFIDLANDVLIASLKELAESHVVLDLDFLTFKTDVVVINVILILILVIISLVAPMIKIKNIRPVKILKTKE